MIEHLALGFVSWVFIISGVQKETTAEGYEEAESPLMAGIGAIVYISLWINSSVDAYRSAKRINDEAGTALVPRYDAPYPSAQLSRHSFDRIPTIGVCYRF